MKNYLSILFVFIFLGTEAQNISGKITYDEDFINSAIDTAKVESNAAKSFIVAQMKATKKALAGNRPLYELHFNNTEAIFEPIPIMASDANPGLKAAISNGVYYTNIQTREDFKQINLSGKTYRVLKEQEKHEWKITDQSKKIQGYTCYRATKKIERPGATITVVAWFAPKIPLSFGPKGYDGLPGLILGLKELGLYYYAHSVALSEKEIDIERPSKGKFVTRNKINELVFGFIDN